MSAKKPRYMQVTESSSKKKDSGLMASHIKSNLRKVGIGDNDVTVQQLRIPKGKPNS
jgi:hypothetical protein